MIDHLIAQMGKLALTYPTIDVCDLYNMLMRATPEAEAASLARHFALMLTIAREARIAPLDIQDMILRN